MSGVALAKPAPRHAVPLGQHVPSAWIAVGEFRCAMRIASSREIFLALSGERVRPGCKPGFRTCAPAPVPGARASANASVVAGRSLAGCLSLSDICVAKRGPMINKKGRTGLRPFNKYARAYGSAGPAPDPC